MAIAKDGILGGFLGKVGNMGGTYLNGRWTAPKKKTTHRKQACRDWSFLAIEFTKPFLQITQQFFNQSVFSGREGIFWFLYTLQKCDSGARWWVYAALEQVLVSSGDLSGFHHLDVTLQDESLHLTWQDNSSQGFAQPNDEVHLL